MQFPLLLLCLFDVAHTLFPLWRSYSCRGVCVGLPLFHRSPFTFWETCGWASNWHQPFFSMNAVHSILLAFLCAAYRFLSPLLRSTTVEMQREDKGFEWRWKMRFSCRVNESQEEQRRLFTSPSPVWLVAKAVVGDVLLHESTEDCVHQGECLWNSLVMP